MRKAVVLAAFALIALAAHADINNAWDASFRTEIHSMSNAYGCTVQTSVTGSQSVVVQGCVNPPIIGDVFINANAPSPTYRGPYAQLFTITAMTGTGPWTLTLDPQITANAGNHFVFLFTHNYKQLNTNAYGATYLACATPTIKSTYAVGFLTNNPGDTTVSWSRQKILSDGEREFHDATIGTTHCMNLDHIMPDTSVYPSLGLPKVANNDSLFVGTCEGGGTGLACIGGTTISAGGPNDGGGTPGICAGKASQCSTLPVGMYSYPVSTGDPAGFEVWFTGGVNVYQGHTLWQGMAAPVTGGITAPKYLYLTGAVVDGTFTCTPGASDLSCGGSTITFTNIASGAVYPGVPAYIANKGYQWNWSASLLIPAGLWVPSLGLKTTGTTAGAHSVDLTFASVDANGATLATVTETLPFTVIANPGVQTYVSSQPNSFPATVPGQGVNLALLADHGTKWCSAPSSGSLHYTPFDSTVNTLATDPNGVYMNGNFLGFGGSQQQWFYDGQRVWFTVKSIFGNQFGDRPTIKTWVAGASYNSGDIVQKTTALGLTWFVATPTSYVGTVQTTPYPSLAGNAGGTEPTWNTVVNSRAGALVADNQVTWINFANDAFYEYCAENSSYPFTDWTLATHAAGWTEPDQMPFGILYDLEAGGDRQCSGSTLKGCSGGTVTQGRDAAALGWAATPTINPSITFGCCEFDALDSRLQSYSLMTVTTQLLRIANGETVTLDPTLKNTVTPMMVDILLGYVDQSYSNNWFITCPAGNCARPTRTNWGLNEVKPFMLGLMIESLIDYYEYQIFAGQVPDNRIPPTLQLALANLWSWWTPNLGVQKNHSYSISAFPEWVPDYPFSDLNDNLSFNSLNGYHESNFAWMWSKVGNSVTVATDGTTGCSHDGTTCLYFSEIADQILLHMADYPAEDYFGNGGKEFNQFFKVFSDYWHWRFGTNVTTKTIGGTPYAYSPSSVFPTSILCNDGTNPPCTNAATLGDLVPPYYTRTSTVAGLVPTFTPLTGGFTASVTWYTFENSTSQVCRSTVATGPFTSCILPSNTPDAVNTVANLWLHTVTVTGLLPLTKYFVTLGGTDAAGNAAKSQPGISGAGVASAYSFTTLASGSCSITTTTLPDGTVGVAYLSPSLQFAGCRTPVVWSISAGTLPPGLILASNGLISGFPSTPGTYPFTVKVTDANSNTATQPLQIVIAAAVTCKITTTTLPGGNAGVPYLAPTLQSSDCTAPLVWVIADGLGTLPPGLSLSTSGNITGTPTLAGTFNFTVQVTDANSKTALQPLQIVVVGTIFPLAITTRSLPRGLVSFAYSAQLTASGGVQPYLWTVVHNALPRGLVLSTSGALSGTPTAGGVFLPTFRITDFQSHHLDIAFPMVIETRCVTVR